jgi:two-component system, NtrC family, sensor histidine kinase HydH
VWAWYHDVVADDDPAGMPLADGRRMADLAASRELWRGQRNRYFLISAKRSHTLLMIGGGVFQAAVIVALACGGLATWRLIALGGAFLTFALTQRVILWKTPDPDRVDAAFFRVSLVGQMFLVACLTLTGGLDSPYLASAVLPVIVPLMFFGPHPVTRGLTALWALLMIAVAILPIEVTGMPVARTTYVWAALGSLGTTMFVLHNVFAKIANAAHGAACSIDSLREERMASAEEQHRRLQAVGSKVAHELKNPLAAIKGLVQLVARTPASERTQERLAVVQAEVTRMETILREYLSFTRPLEDLAPQSIDLATVATDVVAVLAGRADQGRLTVRVDARPAPLSADPRRLREALINLLANAVEATPAGGRIEIATRATAGGGGVLTIRDTGRGIAAADLDRLGGSFFTTRDDGTGLGVVLAHGVVSQHGGTLHYASELGRGTEVTIELPAAPTDARHPLTTATALPPLPATAKPGAAA